jgi:hypothetical protein
MRHWPTDGEARQVLANAEGAGYARELPRRGGHQFRVGARGAWKQRHAVDLIADRKAVDTGYHALDAVNTTSPCTTGTALSRTAGGSEIHPPGPMWTQDT